MASTSTSTSSANADSDIAQTALALINQLSDQSIIEGIGHSPERKTARTERHELSPDSIGEAESPALQTRSLLVPQVPEGYVAPRLLAPPLPVRQQQQPQNDLLTQMRSMMDQLLDEKLNQQSSSLSAALTSSIEEVRSEIVAERVARESAQSAFETRLSNLEAASASGSRAPWRGSSGLGANT